MPRPIIGALIALNYDTNIVTAVNAAGRYRDWIGTQGNEVVRIFKH